MQRPGSPERATPAFWFPDRATVATWGDHSIVFTDHRTHLSYSLIITFTYLAAFVSEQRLSLS